METHCTSTFFTTPCEMTGPHDIHRAVIHHANVAHTVVWETNAADITHYHEVVSNPRHTQSGVNDFTPREESA
jgi:hypothetical protein